VSGEGWYVMAAEWTSAISDGMASAVVFVGDLSPVLALAIALAVTPTILFTIKRLAGGGS